MDTVKHKLVPYAEYIGQRILERPNKIAIWSYTNFVSQNE